MSTQLVALFQDKSRREVARDYFIHYVMQHEVCLEVENKKRFVLVPSWLARNEYTDCYRQSLQKMTDWYWKNFSVLAEDRILTFDSLYLYVPIFLAYLEEVRRLWQELSAGKELPAYREDGEFWGELVAMLKQHSKHQHLILPYLQWRYGDRTIKSFPQHNLPPNPFTEERVSFFNKRRDNYRATDRPTDRRQQPFARGDNREDKRRRPVKQRDGLTDEMNAEIKSAIALLRGDDKQVTLKPANSYYRRLQHKVIAELGFNSRSVNKDNNERAVRIVRKTKRQ